MDWAIEAVGRAETLQQAVACLRPGGTAVALGIGRVGATFQLPINELVQQQKRVVGSLYGSANPPLDLPRLWRRTRHAASAGPLLGAEYPLASVNDAYDALVGGGGPRGPAAMTDEFAMYPSLRGQVAFVSGGATGLGAEFVTQPAAQGVSVGFVDLQDDAGQALASTVAELGHPPPLYRHCDVRDVAALRAGSPRPRSGSAPSRCWSTTRPTINGTRSRR